MMKYGSKACSTSLPSIDLVAGDLDHVIVK